MVVDPREAESTTPFQVQKKVNLARKKSNFFQVKYGCSPSKTKFSKKSRITAINMTTAQNLQLMASKRRAPPNRSRHTFTEKKVLSQISCPSLSSHLKTEFPYLNGRHSLNQYPICGQFVRLDRYAQPFSDTNLHANDTHGSQKIVYIRLHRSFHCSLPFDVGVQK